jgi:hypothetical protein
VRIPPTSRQFRTRQTRRHRCHVARTHRRAGDSMSMSDTAHVLTRSSRPTRCARSAPLRSSDSHGGGVRIGTFASGGRFGIVV